MLREKKAVPNVNQCRMKGEVQTVLKRRSKKFPSNRVPWET